MEVSLLRVCDHALIAGGKLSVIGIFSRMNVPKVPHTVPRFFIAMEMSFSPSEVRADRPTSYKIRLEVRDQDGRTLVELRREMKVSGRVKIGDQAAAPEVIGLDGVTFRRTGPHQVTLWVNEELKGDVRFDIARKPPTPSGGGDG